jgi:hypothetical protein
MGAGIDREPGERPATPRRRRPAARGDAVSGPECRPEAIVDRLLSAHRIPAAAPEHPQRQLTLETKSLAEMSNALTEMSNNQNEEVKKISAWAAILFAPTLVGTVYGMNFENVPELKWELGYPLALALMALLGVAL